MTLSDTRVLVTGAGSGIGRAVATKLASSGAYIYATDKNRPALEKLRSECGEHCSILVADLSDANDRVRLASEVASIARSIDWLIHSAGYIDMTEPEGGRSETFCYTFEVNVFAPFELNRLCARFLAPNGGSIFIASTAGIGGNGKFPMYAASKAALISLAKSLALQWENSKRRSIAICPGPTNTPMREGFGDASTHQSPIVITDLVSQIIAGTADYRNGDIIVVRNGECSLHNRMRL